MNPGQSRETGMVRIAGGLPGAGVTLHVVAHRLVLALLSVLSLLAAAPAHAQMFPGTTSSSPMFLVTTLAVLALAPFIVIMMTSFVKISVVLAILRNALGTQQIPPTQVITGLSFVLTIFIMTPTVEKVFQAANLDLARGAPMVSEQTWRATLEGMKRGQEPIKEFLKEHADQADLDAFFDMAIALRKGDRPDTESFQVLVPAFVTSELKDAFRIGFLLFLPFLVIDLVTANILMAMGMMMMSPQTVALPFKILLFVMTNGWLLVIKGLVSDYLPR